MARTLQELEVVNRRLFEELARAECGGFDPEELDAWHEPSALEQVIGCVVCGLLLATPVCLLLI